MSEETAQMVYKALTIEPQTPNEIAKSIKLNQKTYTSVYHFLIHRQ